MKPNNSHKTKLVHIDENGDIQNIYTSGVYHNDLHLKDGTPVNLGEFTNKNNVVKDGDTYRIDTSNRRHNYPESSNDEWSDYAYTADDL